MSRISQFRAFDPNFFLAGHPDITDRFIDAWRLASTDLEKKISTAPPEQSEFVWQSVLGPKGDPGSGWLNCGFPVAAQSFGLLSDHIPYSARVQFEDEVIAVFSLTLHLLNPRLFLSSGAFEPAKYDGETGHFERFEAFADGPRKNDVGLLVVQDPDPVSLAERFAELTRGIAEDQLSAPAGSGFADLDPFNLDARLDMEMHWRADFVGEKLLDWLGRPLCLPRGGTGNAKQTIARLFAPGLTEAFHGMVHSSGYVGLNLGDTKELGAAILLVMQKPDIAGGTWDTTFRALRREFGLNADFKGVLLQKVGVHWLDSSCNGHDTLVDISVQAAAFAFSGGSQDNNRANTKWYVTAALTVGNEKGERVFGILKRKLELRASFAEGGVRYASLQGGVADDADIPEALSWLHGEDVTVSMIRFASGAGKAEYGAELALHSTGDRIIARIPASNNPWDAIATALIFAPLAVRSSPIPSGADLPPADPRSRGYFVELASPSETAIFLGGAQLTKLGLNSDVFKNAFKPKELRVTDVYLRAQPRRINDPNAKTGETEYALLFDFEADYAVEFDGGPKTARNVTTRIEGTGLGIDGRGLRWVQMSGGLFELSLDDPGLWELAGGSGLGKILRVVSVRLRRDPRLELEIQVRLAGNFGIVKASDLVFRIDLATADSRLIAFPSSIEVDIPGVLKGRGSLYQGQRTIHAPGGDKVVPDLIGALDLTLHAIGLRMYGALRLTRVEDGAGGDVSALLASAEIEFPTIVPIGSSGLGLRSIGALYGQNMLRNEPEEKGAVFPALGWYADAGGDVVKSVEHPNLWIPENDSWSFGAGAGVELIASGKLLNLNAMLVVESPGPVVSLFCKVNVLRKPKDAKTLGKAGLVVGILGVVQVNIPKHRLDLGAVVDLPLGNIAKIHGSVSNRYDLKWLPGWHFYVGTYEDPITVHFDLGGVLQAEGTLYFMAAGDELTKLPASLGYRLDGFALALGAGMQLQIGDGSLYLRVSAGFNFGLQISDGIFAAGDLFFGGEFRLFIVSLGVSGLAKFTYLSRNPPWPGDLYMYVEACASFDCWLFEVSGCIHFEIGSQIAPATSLPDLVQQLKSAPRADIAVLGSVQAAEAIGAEVSQADGDIAAPVPLDAALVIDFSAPPRNSAADPSSIILKKLPPAAVQEHYTIGGVKNAFYSLNAVRLIRVKDSKKIDIPVDTVHWWRQGTKEGGGQPQPVSLVLGTRDLVGATDAMTDPEALDKWIDTVLGHPCEPAREPSPGLYRFNTTHVTVPRGPDWSLTGTGADPDDGPDPQILGLLNVSAMPLANPWLGAGAKVVTVFPVGHPLPVLRLDAPGNFEDQVEVEFRLDDFTGDHDAWIIMAIASREPKFVEQSFAFRDVVGGTDLYVDEIVDLQDEDDGTTAWFMDSPVWRDYFVRFAQIGHSSDTDRLCPVAVRLRQTGTDFAGIRIAFRQVNDEGDVPLRRPAIVGGVVATPSSERRRWELQEQQKEAAKAGLEGLFNNDALDLLDPDTDYRVEVDATPSVGPQQHRVFKFRTAADPPRSLNSYMLCAVPDANGGPHYFGDTPGIVLSSPDILRVLAAFDARLRVTITHDGHKPVTGPNGVSWSEGHIIDPAKCDDPAHPPAGLELRQVAGVPGALIDAVLAATEAGHPLSCLKGLKLSNSALWVGFRATLDPLVRYTVRMDLVHPGGQPWEWKSGAAEPPGSATPFFRTAFATSRHATMQEHAENLSGRSIANRLCLAPEELAGMAPVADAGFELPGIVPDKKLEDALAAAMGLRPDLRSAPQTIILWQPGTDPGEIVPFAVAVASDERMIHEIAVPEPLVREFPDGRKSRTVERVPRPRTAPSIAGSTGFKRVFMGSGGTVLVALLAADAAQKGAALKLAWRNLPNLPEPEGALPTPATLLDLTADALRPRRIAEGGA